MSSDAAATPGGSTLAGRLLGRSLIGLAILCGLLLAASGSAAGAAGSCPNEAIRIQQTSDFLPDCRAYEKVSPAEKNFQNAIGWGRRSVTPDGDTVLFGVRFAPPGSKEGGAATPFLATRNPSTGWDPGSPIDEPAQGDSSLLQGFSADFSKVVVNAHIALTPGGTTGPDNLYLRDEATSAHTLLTPNAPPQPPLIPFLNVVPLYSFAGASADFSNVVYQANTEAFLGAPAQTGDMISGPENTYQWVNGQLRLLGVLPGGGISPTGTSVGSGPIYGTTHHAVSRDGSRVFFHAGQRQAGPLFLRDDQGTASVADDVITEVSASQKTNGAGPAGTDPAGPLPAVYLDAEADGGKVLFASCEQLTNDSDAGDPNVQCASDQPYLTSDTRPVGFDLYLYDIDRETLTDLTPAPGSGDLSGIVGASDALDRIYFVAGATLASKPGPTGALPEPGESNLYLWTAEDGIRFIATLRTDSTFSGQTVDPLDWELPPSRRITASRVAPDGEHMLFSSRAPLTGFDNESPACFEDRCMEIYLYGAGPGDGDVGLTCISCGSGGAPLVGDASLYSTTEFISGTPNPEPLAGNLSSDGGRAFFETPNALAATDSNGVGDVYEWNGERARLISTGSDDRDSHFVDATPTGGDVFFSTYQQLAGGDNDENADLFDARIGGGFAEPPASAPPCREDACQGAPPQQPSLPVPATQTFSAPGNEVPAKHDKSHRRHRGKHHRKDRHSHRCVGKRHRKDHTHRCTGKHHGKDHSHRGRGKQTNSKLGGRR